MKSIFELPRGSVAAKQHFCSTVSNIFPKTSNQEQRLWSRLVPAQFSPRRPWDMRPCVINCVDIRVGVRWQSVSFPSPELAALLVAQSLGFTAASLLPTAVWECGFRCLLPAAGLWAALWHEGGGTGLWWELSFVFRGGGGERRRTKQEEEEERGGWWKQYDRELENSEVSTESLGRC